MQEILNNTIYVFWLCMLLHLLADFHFQGVEHETEELVAVSGQEAFRSYRGSKEGHTGVWWQAGGSL